MWVPVGHRSPVRPGPEQWSSDCWATVSSGNTRFKCSFCSDDKTTSLSRERVFGRYLKSNEYWEMVHWSKVFALKAWGLVFKSPEPTLKRQAWLWVVVTPETEKQWEPTT